MTKRKIYRCCDCNAVISVGWRKNMRKWCFECGLKRSLEAARQMAQRSGPAYDQWLKSVGPNGRPRGTGRKE